MSDNIQEVQTEGLSVQESEETVSIFVEHQEFKINKSLLFRKVHRFRVENFPLPLKVDIESFEAFSVWLHTDKLPVLHGIYDEKEGKITYVGYDPETMYKLAICSELELLADNIMDCIRQIHNSLGIGFTKDQIEKIYKEQVVHWGLTLYAALWIHLEDTRPNNYLKLTTKAERDDLLKNEFVALDVNIQRGPWYPGNQNRCRFHIHHAQINEPCIRNHSIDVCSWVVDKDDELRDLHDWRMQRLLNPVKIQSSSSPQLSEVVIDTRSD
ncbi:hypothetical protein BPAE_0028g00670 [Botrytis paeoniae]|uniref:Uncharacterized protein n=1 Tax=Botrytis paeoniae TaxID=278948 RepID=A0A4Z1FXR1_9HELO|nr:hypothetical protein BPAE_0028g00670 [Botrytis paeoniae]